MKIQSQSFTRYSDWYNNKEIPLEIFNSIEVANLIGELEWIETGITRKKKYPIKNGIITKLLKERPKREDTYLISAGGSKPFDWRLDIGMFPYSKEINQVRGINSFTLQFDSLAFPGMDGSDHLFEVFRKINSQNNIESAYIHPLNRYEVLKETLNGEYGEPVTFSPLFDGVFWLTFIGKEHLLLFDKEKLDMIDSDLIRIKTENILLLRVCQTIEEVLEPKIEESMFKLTRQLKLAR